MTKEQNIFRSLIIVFLVLAVILAFYQWGKRNSTALPQKHAVLPTVLAGHQQDAGDYQSKMQPGYDSKELVSDFSEVAELAGKADRSNSNKHYSQPMAAVSEQQDRKRIQPTREDAMAAVHAVENQAYKTANSLFQQESVDYPWASAYEATLRDIFATQQGLDRVSVDTISCRSTMCQIVVFTPQSRDADFFTAMFYQALETYEDGKYKTTAAITRSMTNGITAIYVTREGHALEFYQRLKY